MKSPFRPVSFWQSALMILPDAAFFDLMRSILGNFKTPFNKQTLVEELSRFIVRPEIQENIAAYIDDNDRRIIAAVALLSEPVPGELESFFSGEYSYTELQSMLLNLEERLIIYRFRDDGVLRIALNPRLENILAPYAENKGILFSAIEKKDTEKTTEKSVNKSAETSSDGALNNRTLAAFFAFLFNSEVQIKDEEKGAAFVFKRKTSELGKALFPDLEIDLIAGGILALGLLSQDREELVPDEARIADFKELSDRKRFEYLAGGIAFFLQRGAVSYQGAGILRSTIRLVCNFSDIAKERKILPEATMIKLAELFRRKEETSWASPASWGFPAELPPAAVLLRSLVIAGLFSLAQIDGKNCYCPVELSDVNSGDTLLSEAKFNKNGSPEKKADNPPPVIAMDSGLSCILYPEISFADAMDLASFSFVEETGTAVRFSLSRDSVVSGLNRGYSANFLWELLERLSCGRVPGTLKWNLDDWEKRWKDVSITQGVILSLDAGRDYLAETKPIAGMITRRLAPGIFLLSVGIDEITAALSNAGVDIVGHPKKFAKNKTRLITAEDVKTGAKIEPMVKPEIQTIEKSEAQTDHIKKQFRAILDTMTLTKQEREELESRIDRRVVVSETQLKDTSLRYERLEARSLDYVGKTGLVKQAIVSGSLLEISCLNGEKILGFPESLDKKSGEMLLSIRPKDGGETVKLPLGKISLIRRIKQSIFGV